MKSQRSRSPLGPNRRQFLGQSGCAALSSVSILNTLLNLKLAGSAAAQAAPTDYRTLVCVFLHGGNDSFNWLVPRDTTRHAIYSTTRDNLALPRSSLLSLTQSGGDGQEYGVHPSCPGLQEMFNGVAGDPAKRRAAWVSNVGTLIAPVTKTQFLAESIPLPKALFSHSDQIDQWQTSVPQGMAELSGWCGRAADVLHASANASNFSMNLSLSGNNVLQVGNQTSQFVVTEQGALTFAGSQIGDPTHYHRIKNAAHRSILEQQYSNLVQESYSALTRSSIELQEFFLQQFNTYNDSAVAGHFPNSWLGSQFRAAAKLIGLRQALGLHRQTIFIGFGGWDHHTELLTSQAPMLAMLDAGLAGLQKALDAMGAQDSVITFTSSDFSRTLRSNGRGTDHAWGANALVMGGPVQGGRIYGSFPNLALDSNNDTGYGGRMIPTTSVDQFVGEMLRWFGVKASDMPYVLPNLGNFYNASSPTLPIGFLKPGTWT